MVVVIVMRNWTLYKAVCISLHANALGKGHESICFPTSRQIGFFNLGKKTSLGEGKLCIQTSWLCLSFCMWQRGLVNTHNGSREYYSMLNPSYTIVITVLKWTDMNNCYKQYGDKSVLMYRQKYRTCR